MDHLLIRPEQTGDYRAVEELHRRAFWNLYVPGCQEHYIAHVLRSHPDFVPELDLVCEVDGCVVASIMYTRSWLTDRQGTRVDILTFGPLAVDPALQRRGVGKRLMAESFRRAAGCPAVVIFGNPGNYVSSGFKSCRRCNVCLEGDVFPAAMLVRELTPGFFDGRRYRYADSPAFQIDPQAAEDFDRDFPPMERAFQPSQEEFFIHSNSVIRLPADAEPGSSE